MLLSLLKKLVSNASLCLIAACLFAPSSAFAQSLDAEVQRDPNAGLATYDFHFNGPPRGSAYLFLPPAPNLPNGVIPWSGQLFDSFGSPLFFFNLTVENLSSGEVKIRDNNIGGPGGITCLVAGGCAPIALLLPFNFQPIVPLSFQPFSINVDVNFSNYSLSQYNPNSSISLGFVQPLADLFTHVYNPFATTVDRDPYIDQLIAPLPVAPATQLQPVTTTPGTQGLDLSFQTVVNQAFAPVVVAGGLDQDERLSFGDTMSITVSVISEPISLALMLMGVSVLLLIRRDRRKIANHCHSGLRAVRRA